MDVFNLAAQITLNSKQFEEALGQSEGSLANLGKSIIKTQAMVKGLEMGFNAMKQIVSGGIDAYANYEQLVGGVDTLFKSGSQKVQEYAKNAFNTAGLSANQYMETVTSFSASLIQGMEKNAKKAAGTTRLTSEQLEKLYGDAADVADIAIRDMSDNANKMGTDMQSIQNAYQGFAKGNFTMLDNLKLGYGGTKTEMVRLINDSGVLNKKIKNIDKVSFDQMIEAIHAIQQELGITGTTAEEAMETISGSKSSMLAAFQNLLTFATDGTDKEALEKAQDAFVSSFAAYFNNNLAPRISQGLKGSTKVIETVVTALLTIDEDTLTTFVDGALKSGTGLITGLTSLTGWLFDQIGNVFSNPTITEDDATKFGSALGDFVGTFVKNGLEHLPNVISGLFTAGVNVANGFIQGLVAGLFGTGSDSVAGDIKAVDDEMAEAIKDANNQAIKANGLITWLDDLQKKYGEAAVNMPEWEEAMKGLIALNGDYFYFFDQETKKINTSTDAMKKHTEQIRNMQIEEAKNRALGEKQQIVDNLEAERTNAEATITAQQYQQTAIMNDAMGTLNKVLGEFGFSGKLYSGMSAEDFGNVIREISLGYGDSTEQAEDNVRAWTKEIEENGLGFKQLTDLIDELNGHFNIDSEELLSEIENQRRLYDESQKEIDKANATVKQIDNDLVSARYSLRIAREALELWAKNLGYAVPRPVNAPHGYTLNDPLSRNAGIEGSFATGLDRVPFDGYVAELHRNEAILTSADADTWRRGGGSGVDYGEMARTISGAIIEGMGQVGFYFDRDQVAAAVTQRVSQNIADGMAAWGNA